MTKVLGVIPARLASSRIPEKMLQDICGKPLIQWTIERTKKARSLDALVVSTDSERIAVVARALNVPVIMTPTELPTGTDRVAATVKLFKDFEPAIVANIWGDEPLYPASAIDACVEELRADDTLQVACAADRIEDEQMLAAPSIVKVLTDLDGYALSFSRAPIPFAYNQSAPYTHYHVIGAMAMRRSFLERFITMPQTPIELREGVEQMRIIEHGVRMRVVCGDYRNLGVNTPEELEEVRTIMAARS